MQGDFNKRTSNTWRPADDDTTYPAWTSPLQKIYSGVELDDGKGVTDIGTWMPDLVPEKYYAFKYIVLCAE